MPPPSGFSPTSRYAATPTATWTAPDGREVVHLTRRFPPDPASLGHIRDHLVQSDDRLDNITAQHLGDPEQFWQIADANTAFDPAELTRTPGRRLRITLPQGVPAPVRI